jgi:hypothetical protein
METLAGQEPRSRIEQFFETYGVPTDSAFSRFVPNPTGEHYVEFDPGCLACMLGGEDEHTLFLIANEWDGPEGMADGEATGQVLTTRAPAPGVGWP